MKPSNSDKPYYDLGYSQKETSQANSFERRLKKSDTSVSKTVTWYHQENEKRRNGMQNEIDIAEIKAASRGVRNSWTCVFKNFPKKFAELLHKNNFDYAEFEKLKNQLQEKDEK
jgi:hypothetical protein